MILGKLIKTLKSVLLISLKEIPLDKLTVDSNLILKLFWGNDVNKYTVLLDELFAQEHMLLLLYQREASIGWKKYKQVYNFGLEKLKGKIYREPRRKLHFANTPEQRYLAKTFDTV